MLRTGCALLLAALLSTVSASAQGPGTKFAGIIGGATLSDIDNTPAFGDDRWGGTAGLIGGINAGRTALTLEAYWIQKGGGDRKLDYIEFPLTLGAIFAPETGATRVRLYSGVSFGFSLSSEAKDTEWGLPIGLQVAKVTDTGKFFGIDARYTFPLTNVFEVGDGHNRVWAFRLMFGKAIGSSSR